MTREAPATGMATNMRTGTSTSMHTSTRMATRTSMTMVAMSMGGIGTFSAIRLVSP